MSIEKNTHGELLSTSKNIQLELGQFHKGGGPEAKGYSDAEEENKKTLLM